MIDRAYDSGGATRPVLKLLIVDDHPVVRAGLAALFAPEDDVSVVAEASHGPDAVALHQRHAPDVTLVGLRMARADGIATIRAICAAQHTARIVALSSSEGDVDIHRALLAGACGYLLEHACGADIVNAVRTAASGHRVIPPEIAGRLAEYTPRLDLTEREIEVLRFAKKGLRNKEIARVIGRTEDTIKSHLKSVMAKLGTSDRTEAVTVALERGFLHLFD